MAGAVISSVASWLGTQLINEGNFLHGIEDQVRCLQRELGYIALYLEEAEYKVESGEEARSEALRLFTKQVRDIAFRAEDGVDNYILDVASSCKTNIGGNFLTELICCLCDSADKKEAIHICIKAMEEIKQVQKPRLIAIRERINQPRPNRNKILTYPHTQDAYVVGRDENVETLVRRLTCSMDISVVAIVGAGGIGKTTLARKIFTDIRVQNHFRATAWVSISQQWNPRYLLFEILTDTKGIRDERRQSSEDWSVKELVEGIHGYLSQRSYLLVLDDMWDREAWNCIYPAISSRGFGSKVIITTRIEHLPSQLVDQKCFTHEPQLLTEEQSWQLFQKIALEQNDTQVIVDDYVVRLGKEMTQKCGGLPLGIVTLAGLLRTKDTFEWEDVSKKFNSILLNIQGPSHYGRSVYQTLTLSYYDLPHYVKPCFLYLALFPEVPSISCKMLTKMWVAEGFVPTSVELGQVNEVVEDVAEQFLNELIQRRVVQVVEKSITTGKAKICLLHDLTRDFCIAKAEEQRFFHSSTDQSNATTSVSTRARRVSMVASKTSFSPTQHAQIRSFSQFGGFVPSADLCEVLKLLRILILAGVKVHDGYLPKEFGNLRHLRYLVLRNTNIKTLPKSIENLSNLLYLKYMAIFKFEAEPLPNVFWKMKSLRQLYFDFSVDLMYVEDLKLHTLTNLQTLWFTSMEKCLLDAEMETLSPSIRKLGVSSIRSQQGLDALFRSPCMVSGNLVNLMLTWNPSVTLECKQLLHKYFQCLQKLDLFGKIQEDYFLQFPPHLVELKLTETQQELEFHDPMVALGKLGHLKFLRLHSAFKGNKMTVNTGSFPKLERLGMFDFEDLVEWRIEKGAMPGLKNLLIYGCRKLERLPEGLKFIRSLRELEIQYMPRSFCRRLYTQGDETEYSYRAGVAEDGGGERGEDFHVIQHISQVSFGSESWSDSEDEDEYFSRLNEDEYFSDEDEDEDEDFSDEDEDEDFSSPMHSTSPNFAGT